MPERPSRNEYRTLTTESRIRLEVRRSVFIGTAAPASCEADAVEVLKRVRSEFPDASHHVYAWTIGGRVILQKHSDDGEPQGTGGIPVLDVLRKQGLENAAVVVTRYFGGVLLGTGGLIRAYGKAASLAVRAAGPVAMTLSECFRVTLPYASYDRFQHQAQQAGYTLESPVYGADVEMKVVLRAGLSAGLEAMLADCTSGAGLMQTEPSIYVPEAILSDGSGMEED